MIAATYRGNPIIPAGGQESRSGSQIGEWFLPFIESTALIGIAH